MDKAEILALLALKKSGAVDVSQAVAAKTAAQAAQAAAEEAQEGAEAAQAAAEAAAAVFVVDDAMDDTSENPVQNKVIAGELGDLKSRLNAAQIITQAGPSPIAHIADGSANKAKSYDIQIVPQQAGSGDPSPTNVRPITGFTSATVTRVGNNVIRFPAYSSSSYYVTFDGTNVISVNDTTVPGEPSNNRWQIVSFNNDGNTFIPLLRAGTTYTCKVRASGTFPENIRVRLDWYDSAVSDGVNFGSTMLVGSNGEAPAITITPSKDTTEFAKFRVVLENYHGGDVFANCKVYVQIEVGSTATAYEPYAAQDYSIDWSSTAGTVYGGSLHVSEDGSGTLTVTGGYIASYAGETLPGKWISDRNVYAAGTSPSTGAQVVYDLATTQTYTLTAPQIALLLGTNNIWSDTGDMAVEYIADTKLYIQQLTGHPDEDMTADANITSGSFFMIGNTLYLATANIANGSTVVPGTNCTQMSLAAALNSINA